MVNRENLEEAINTAMENEDMELLNILLKLRDEPEPMGTTTEPSTEPKNTGNVNVKAIANYFRED